VERVRGAPTGAVLAFLERLGAAGARGA
jgi:hypothetical protein